MEQEANVLEHAVRCQGMQLPLLCNCKNTGTAVQYAVGILHLAPSNHLSFNFQDAVGPQIVSTDTETTLLWYIYNYHSQCRIECIVLLALFIHGLLRFVGYNNGLRRTS